MIKYIETTIFLRKPVASTPLISIDCSGSQKNAKILLDGTKTMFYYWLSIRYYNKSLTMRTTTNTGKIQKFIRKAREENAGAHLNHKIFSENIIYDLLNVFYKAMGV